jgi:hypothetical protein
MCTHKITQRLKVRMQSRSQNEKIFRTAIAISLLVSHLVNNCHNAGQSNHHSQDSH